MRPELEQLAQIDSYVNNTMSAAESAAFEAEMAINPAMKEAVETQNLLITAVNRKALLAQVVAAAPATVMPPRDGSILSKFKWPIILSSVIVGAVISFFALRGDNEELQKSHDNIHANASNEPSESEGLRASREVDFTYIPANPDIVKTSRRQFGGLETWVAPELQQITIDPTQDELIECKDGTVIFVPEDAFVDANGNVIAEPVTLEIIEALTMDKIVAYNLATMNGDNALKSGGMVYVQPKLNGVNLELAEGKSLHIEVPTDEYDSDMQAWRGVPDGNGNLNWENPQAIENYLIPVAMSSLDFLPNGFREEVAATLPFKSYKTSSRELEDSLYFSLSIPSDYAGDDRKVEVTAPTNRGKTVITDKTGKVLESNTNTTEAPRQSNRKGLYRIDKRGKVQKGIGGVQFQNLPDRDDITATFNLKDKLYNTRIDSSVLKTDLLGFVSITLKSKDCAPYTINNVLVEEEKIVFVDCYDWGCGVQKNEEPCEKCYINPSDIFAIHQPEFEETFLATREFQERLQALHKIENAQPLFGLYINNLDKNLHEIDRQVADRLTGNDKRTFEEFAAEILTTVKPNGQEYAELKKFYSAKLNEQRQKTRKAQEAHAQKSAAELQAVQDEMAQLRFDFNQSQRLIQSKYAPKRSKGVSPPRGDFMSSPSSFQAPQQFQNTNPQVGQQAAYKVNWYGTGWMNIDGFLHELSKGKKQIPIHVADSKGMKVYQSVNSMNTLLTLNKTDEGYNAYFPTANSATFVKSLALGVSRSADGQLKVAAQFFNPYASSAITLNDWESVSEDEFKQRLKNLYPGGRRLLKAIKTEERLNQEAEERKRRAEEQRKKQEKELKALEDEFQKSNAQLEAKTEKIRMRQAAERSYMQHLEDFINPCHANYGKSSVVSRSTGGIVEFPDEEAQFPGGTVEFMRWISHNVQYPQGAMDAGVQGKIFVEFVVEPDGSASNVKISNSDPRTKLLEAEAVRLVQGMPPWKSGQMSGENVRTRCRIPIIFTLD